MDTTPLSHARSILDSMLGYLGFTVKIEESDGPEGPTLQILTEDGDRLIGRHGETLEDIQYHLYVLEKIRRGRADIEAGRSYTTEQARERLAKWLPH